MPGWKKSTEGIASWDKLPAKAQSYLQFLEKETGVKIGMVSTGPDRDQTMTLAGFEEALK
jgi:adenylosuccinate synthase